MMDVSDGLLLDASRLAAASGLTARIELETLPLSEAFLATLGEDRAARLFAASAGDDYELLFAAAPDRSVELLALGEALGVPLSRIGTLEAGEGVRISHDGEPLPLPPRLGWEHGGR